MCFMGKCHNPIFQTHDIFEHMASNILIYKLESENIKKNPEFAKGFIFIYRQVYYSIFLICPF